MEKIPMQMKKLSPILWTKHLDETIMNQINSFLSSAIFIAFMIAGFNSCAAKTKDATSDITLVASTPGEEQITSPLGIPADIKVDFIRWNLVLKGSHSSSHSFQLDINYGKAQPNTLGFMNGGEKRSIQGEFSITNEKSAINGEVYHLKSTAMPGEILLIKLNENIFHLLTPKKELMVGNGGWSYTLNRKEPLTGPSMIRPVFKVLQLATADTARQIILSGRTPCLDMAHEKKLTVAADCFKLKWKLILNKDPKTLKPTTYRLHRTNSRESDLTGKWSIVEGIPSNRDVIIYQLDPDKPEQTISLYLADVNIALFLKKNNELFIGNENFSYTLNREIKNK